MIRFNDWTISINGYLAHQYDNLTRKIEVRGDIPDGWDWSIHVQVGDNLDIIALNRTDNGLSAELTREQLAFEGHYMLQIKGVQGDKVRHTNIIRAYVGKSISGDAKWPTVPSEFTQFEQKLTELSTHPPVPGDNGFWLIWNAEKDEYEESGFALPSGGGIGQDGEDGFSPIATVTQTSVGAAISITDKNGTTTATVTNGKDGAKGDTGAPGANGKDGNDYVLTNADKQEIARIALELLPAAEGVSY